MTAPDYLSLSPEDRTKFFCESCGIEKLDHYSCPNCGSCNYSTAGKEVRICQTCDTEFLRADFPTLTLDFLFEWLSKQKEAVMESSFEGGDFMFSVWRVYHRDTRKTSWNESPTLALQIAILRWKGAIE